MFDTIILPEEVRCKCGYAIASFQTKRFDCLLEVYSVGDKVEVAKGFVSGVIEDYLFCDLCHDTSINIFFALKDGILVSVDLDKQIVEKELAAFGYEKLLRCFNSVSKTATNIKRDHRELIINLHYFIDFLESLGDQQKLRSTWGVLGDVFIRDHLEKGNIIDTLKSILKDV